MNDSIMDVVACHQCFGLVRDHQEKWTDRQGDRSNENNRNGIRDERGQSLVVDQVVIECWKDVGQGPDGC